MGLEARADGVYIHYTLSRNSFLQNSFIRKPFRYVYYNAVLKLIIINVAVFFLQFLTRNLSANLNLTSYLALNPAAIIINKAYWQFFTYMFAHDPNGIAHILFNMIALFVFGNQLERYMGSREFLLYYLVTGVLAGVLSFGAFMLTGNYYVFLLGASGAIFAVQLAYAAFFPNNVLYIWGILPLRAPVLVLGFTAIELFSVLRGANSGGVAHLTHLFGFLTGALYSLIRWGANPFKMMFRR